MLAVLRVEAVDVQHDEEIMKTRLVAFVRKLRGISEDEGGQVVEAGVDLDQGTESGVLVLRGHCTVLPSCGMNLCVELEYHLHCILQRLLYGGGLLVQETPATENVSDVL
jgi:hypothetical protein